MIFSIFGSKKEKAARRKDADTTTRHGPATSPTVNQREIARQTAKKIDEIESQMDLAIPAKVVKPDAAPPAPELAPPPAPGRVLPPSIQEGGLVMFPPARPAPPVAPAASGGLSLVPRDDASPTDILGETGVIHSVEVLSTGLLPVFEEGSVLYANGQSNEAAMLLWQAIKENQLGNHTQQAWKMLFELYQASGRRPDFESLAIDFASRFESSPPTWSDDLSPPSREAAPTVASSVIQFPPKLDAQAVKPIEQLQRAAQRNRPAEVDFSRISVVDAAGANLLLRVLLDYRKHSRSLTVAGAEALANALANAVETGRRDPSDACWQLRLEVLRLLGNQTAFEDLAIDFCVTYEVSPPSWEALPKSIRLQSTGEGVVAEVDGEAGAGSTDETYAFEGELEGRPDALFKGLKAFAEGRNEVIIDCRRLRRMDFVCAGEVLNEVAGLRGAGKYVIFKDLSYLVACLMMVMGVHDLAELNLRTH